MCYHCYVIDVRRSDRRVKKHLKEPEFKKLSRSHTCSSSECKAWMLSNKTPKPNHKGTALELLQQRKEVAQAGRDRWNEYQRQQLHCFHCRDVCDNPSFHSHYRDSLRVEGGKYDGKQYRFCYRCLNTAHTKEIDLLEEPICSNDCPGCKRMDEPIKTKKLKKVLERASKAPTDFPRSDPHCHRCGISILLKRPGVPKQPGICALGHVSHPALRDCYGDRVLNCYSCKNTDFLPHLKGRSGEKYLPDGVEHQRFYTCPPECVTCK